MIFSSLARRLAALAGAVVLCTCGTLDRFDVTTGASAEIPKATILDELRGVVRDLYSRLDEMQHRADLYDLIDYEQYNRFDTSVFNFQIDTTGR